MALTEQETPEEPPSRPKIWSSSIPLWPAFILGGLLFIIWAVLNNWWVPITAVDISQLRADTVLPAPNSSLQISQDFVANKDGLYQVELLLSGQQQDGIGARLEIQLLDNRGLAIASQTVDRLSLGERHPLALTFTPQDASAGQRYSLLISGADGNSASAWAYSLDVHQGGQLALFGAETEAQDLRFVTRYQLSAAAAARALYHLVADNAATILLALALLFMPGCLLLQLGRFFPGHIDPFARLATALALGASLWPVAWLWLTTVGGHWAAWSLWLVLIAGWVATIGLFVFRRLRAGRARKLARGAARLSWHHAALLLILALGFSGRLLAVRDLAFPPWVDSSRHALITNLMAQGGQTITSYQPLLPIDDFPYHFGFHTLSAALMMLGDQTLPRLLLILGQLLNSLVPLTTYGAVYLLTRRRGAGVLAAFLVALPFFFPAYYVTWGRMTQITAVMILPVALAFTWLLLRGAGRWRRTWLLVAFLVAGLFLVHFRVFLLYLPFAGLVWLASRGRHGRRLFLAGGLALLLISPHLTRLLGYVQPETVGGTIPGYNQFPTGYVTIGWERAFLIIAALGLLPLLLALLRRRGWAMLPLLLLGWTLLTGALLSLDRLGLPGTTLINLNSGYIVAFLPLALFLGVIAQQLWRWLVGRRRALDALLLLVAGVIMTATLLFGLRQQVTILNPATILAWSPDGPGLDWLEKNLPEDAKIAVDSWRWLGQTWAGSDGGAWIVPLTGRESTTPPADYYYSPALSRQVNQFNEGAAAWTDWSEPAAAAWLEDQGVSHIYVGAKGGQFEPSALARNPAMAQVYGRDGVFVFELR
jgi:hypothetical protein